ncbi:MAG: S8 family peptidase [Crocinitomicaceae bacterium]|nr:S8 family peptidase [Crocinitomicaceae bacterium]
MVNRSLLLTLLLLLSFSGVSQKLGFNKILLTQPNRVTTFCIPNNEFNIKLLNKEKINVKYSNQKWLFISTTPLWIDKKTSSGELSDFYFEFAPPQLLSDSARAMHFVDDVHFGNGGLPSPYTGKDVIIGYVDTGIDYNHDDFKNADGTTRVIQYWDQALTAGPAPMPYGYGTVWDSSAINNMTITSIDNNAHGTTVAGQGSGNGLANGTNKGMAPDSKIVIVESDFANPNWTLSVADACDFIFSVADSLGLPAVVNLSIGTYLGSHDGNDPASEAIESMLDAKNGRIVVCAAGNSGIKGPYHQHEEPDADTNFVWFNNNPAGTLGANTIFFDLWSDISDATYYFGFAADKVSPNYDLRGTTPFHGAMSSLGVPIYDTIWNGSNRIATIETYTNIVDAAYNMQVVFTAVDSTAYRYRFMTTGSGSYDLWSGAWMGLNDMETVLPTVSEMPAIQYYTMPDTLQTIVSAWNCSEKVISVGNLRNRLGHIDGNYNQYYPPGDMTSPGKIAPKSSKGPNRHNLTKPDISAAGEISLSAAPMWIANNPAWYPSLDSGRLHLRNGGTSMASPVVSGIAALYLEKCNKSSYQDFKNDLLATAYSDGYTGTVPNNAYGFGKAHALNLLLTTNYTATVSGPGGICSDPEDLTINSSTSTDSVWWSNNTSNLPNTISSPGTYSAEVYNENGCLAYTDTLEVVQFIVPTIDPITQTGLVLSTDATDSYQWTLNGVDITGETSSSLTITPPYGSYTCYTVSSDGCIAETDSLLITADLTTITEAEMKLFPNPVNKSFRIKSSLEVSTVEVIGTDGRKFKLKNKNGEYDLSSFTKGIYIIIIETNKGIITTKISRM